MDSLGDSLRKEREKKGITLDDAANITRIRKIYIEALEDGNFQALSPVFIKGFIKSYAQFLGLDGAALIEKHKDIFPKEEELHERKEIKIDEGYNRYAVPLIITLSLIALITITLKFASKKPEIPGQIKPALPKKTAMANKTTPQKFYPQTSISEKIFKGQTTLPTKTSPAYTAKPDVLLHTPAPEKSKSKQTLVVRANEMTWMKIGIDDKEPVEALLRAGEVITWFADNKFMLVVGNAGGVELTLNGKQLESLGPPGKVIVKTFPEENAAQPQASGEE